MDDDKDKSSGIKRASVGDIDLGRFYNWPSSRIVRVSRASGGKDRHSKVLTSKGPRDRRVRLSVNTAIQFYDLQDRLGYDQPSKAVEWLLNAAEGSISELPPMPNNPFPATPKCEEKRSSCTNGGNGSSDQQLALEEVGPVSGEAGDCGGGNNYLLHDQNQQQAVAKSCSSASTTETSKGSSGLSLSRSEIRVKARERAKERVLAEKEDTISQAMTSSFTELLSSGMNNNSSSPNSGSNGNLNESNFFLKSPRQWSASSTTTTTPMDYNFSGGLQMHVSSDPTVAAYPMFSLAGSDNNHGGELQHFSFVPDHHHHLQGNAVNSCNNNSSSLDHQHNIGTLNFTISSLSSPNTSHAGINRGTLQSNSSSSSMFLPASSLQLPQRFSNVDHGSPQSFFIAPMDCNGGSSNNHYQFLSGYDAARMQLFYGGDPTSHHDGNNRSNGSSGGKHSKAKGRN